jgi:hypothetical protein
LTLPTPEPLNHGYCDWSFRTPTLGRASAAAIAKAAWVIICVRRQG